MSFGGGRRHFPRTEPDPELAALYAEAIKPAKIVVMPAGQLRRHSAYEAVVNVIVGYGLAYFAAALIYWLMSIPVSPTQNAVIGLWLTVVSLARSYVLRRIFNRVTIKQQHP